MTTRTHLFFPMRSVFQTYRSTTNIVSAAQKIISSNDSASRKQADLRQDMKPMRGSGPTPRVLACADAKAEGTSSLACKSPEIPLLC